MSTDTATAETPAVTFPFLDTVTLQTNTGKLQLELRITHIKRTVRHWETLEPVTDGLRLSICGSTARSCGQIRDVALQMLRDIPDGVRLIALWDAYHLNDLRAGTKHQTETRSREPDRGYTYGSAWLYQPVDVAAALAVWNRCKAAIETANAERRAAIDAAVLQSEVIDDDTDPQDEFDLLADENGIDADVLRALADHLGVSADDALDYHQEHHQGQWSNLAEWAEQLADDLGMTPTGQSWPLNHIDWEAAADELMSSDYFRTTTDDIYRNA